MRQVVKKIIKDSVVPSRLRTRPIRVPYAPLPADKIQAANPFEVAGEDFAGPLYPKRDPTSHKVYIVLFKCSVIRAVHLELSRDMSAAECLLAFRRFASRRGVLK